MAVSAQQVKELREATGAGLMDCKRALSQADGDQQKARILLREKGLAQAEKRSSRTAGEGIIYSYSYTNDRIGVLVELNCETDFVARNKEFKDLAREICMQITATKPLALSREGLPQELVDSEKAIYAQQVDGKPQHIVEKIVEGKLEKFYSTVCLLDQAYIREESKTIKDLVDDAIARLGEKIVVRRFARMEAGESLD